MPGPEYALVEQPCIDYLKGLGYDYVSRPEAETARDGLNQVLLREDVVEAVQRLNDVPEEFARQVYSELLTITNNERWTSILRGQYSRPVPGKEKHQTIRLIDFRDPENNRFVVTNQVYVKSQKPHRADLVVYVNGIPLVVIEAKRPGDHGTKKAFEQIKQYEEDIPRLFYSNAFSIITDRHELLYGTTGAPSQYWGEWKDPWPRSKEDFQEGFDFRKGLWSLLEPGRLLDLLSHFIVFEREADSGRVVKKMCRYQQYRAASKIVERVRKAEKRKGLVWHTQGSGKSLTMVFTVLKLKMHRTIESPELASPNILVVTDRIDLDDQISSTFQACGLPNPTRMDSKREVQEKIHSDIRGQTLLSTIHKFDGSDRPVPDSDEWIILVDECHRTQEKDLGAYLRATFPEARYFGFTGTPIKKNDRDTFRNFGPPGEGYLDRYSINDAVADGATVPIRYTSRKTEWRLDPAKLDVLFDQWFSDQPEEVVERVKAEGVTITELAKHPGRVQLIAYDIWNHFKQHPQPDGYKAQIVAVDRQAIILYKRALNKVITEDLMRTEGLSEEEARARAERISAPVYHGPTQEDRKPSEDPWVDDMRRDLRRYSLGDREERQTIADFKKQDHPLSFLIVCNKLLTGFDAPIESVMYLDAPLSDQNLLQAIARTNRVAGEKKKFGLIIDYIGITRKLDEALSAYRREDVEHAMEDLEVEREELRRAHRKVMKLTKGIARDTGRLDEEYDALIRQLGTEDAWFTFRRKAQAFIRAYEALSPDPEILDYQDDLKWVTGFIAYATPVFEKEPAPDLSGVSAKIRDLLEQHLEVTGLTTITKLRSITDPDFWQDFDQEEKTAEELRRATIRKATELKKVTREKAEENPLRYEKFSDRVREVIEQFEEGQLAAAEALEEFKQIARDLEQEKAAHRASGLNERAYGVWKILRALEGSNGSSDDDDDEDDDEDGDGDDGDQEGRLQKLARQIDELYASDETAPVGWHMKKELRRQLRQRVREMAHDAGMEDLKEVAGRVEEYALRHYVKVA